MTHRSTLIAAAGTLLLLLTGCGSAPHQSVVLIEPEYSYLREAQAAPLGAATATARRSDAPLVASARAGVTASLDRVP